MRNLIRTALVVLIAGTGMGCAYLGEQFLTWDKLDRAIDKAQDVMAQYCEKFNAEERMAFRERVNDQEGGPTARIDCPN